MWQPGFRLVPLHSEICSLLKSCRSWKMRNQFSSRSRNNWVRTSFIRRPIWGVGCGDEARWWRRKRRNHILLWRLIVFSFWSFMDVNWQYNNPANPAAAKIGPQVYDNHLYYVWVYQPPLFLTSLSGYARFGVGSIPLPIHGYLNGDSIGCCCCKWRSISKLHLQCVLRQSSLQTPNMLYFIDLGRIAADAALQNSPLFFGEWGLPTQFEATDEFLKKWADAQKIAYGKGAGWFVSRRYRFCLRVVIMRISSTGISRSRYQR